MSFYIMILDYYFIRVRQCMRSSTNSLLTKKKESIVLSILSNHRPKIIGTPSEARTLVPICRRAQMLVVAEPGCSLSLSSLTDKGRRKETHWTRGFFRPAHERRHGRTNAPILFFFTVTTWLQHRLTQPIQRQGDLYSGSHRAVRHTRPRTH